MWGCNQPEPQVLRLGTNIWPGYEPLYLAKEIDSFPSNKVRLIEYSSASDVIRAFRNKALEMASLTLDEALLLIQDNIPLKVILVHDISNGADTILARPGITSMQDIIGKRVAVESGALGAYVITRALEINKLSLNDIVIKHINVNQHENAYKNNQVDVVVNFEPVRTRLLNQGAKEIFTSKEIHGEIVDVLVVHEEVFNQNRSTLKEIINSWFTALDYFSQQPKLDKSPGSSFQF
jgi:NitT/TauT family transport system substrate-binding protein